jgi:hypothetical protein
LNEIIPYSCKGDLDYYQLDYDFSYSQQQEDDEGESLVKRDTEEVFNRLAWISRYGR